ATHPSPGVDALTSRLRPSASALDTPPPSARPTIKGTPRTQPLPTRQSSHGKKPSSAPPSAVEESAKGETTEKPQPTQKPKATPTSPDFTGGHRERVSLEDRLGPIGVAVCAMLLCAVVWFLTWKLF